MYSTSISVSVLYKILNFHFGHDKSLKKVFIKFWIFDTNGYPFFLMYILMNDIAPSFDLVLIL